MKIARYSVPCFLLACVLAGSTALPAVAGDSWKEKKAAEWTRGDAILVISNSPWAVQTKLQYGNYLVPAPGANLPPPMVDTPRQRTGLQDPGTRLPIGSGAQTQTFVPLIGIGVGEMPTQKDLDPLHREKPKVIPQAPSKAEVMAIPLGSALVIWDSAPPVVAAKAKLGITDTPNSQQAKYYSISVLGYPLQAEWPLDQKTMAVLHNSAELRIGREVIQVVAVEVTNIENVLRLRFLFPKDRPIQSGDREVVFTLHVGLGDIATARFKLKDMQYLGKLAVSE